MERPETSLPERGTLSQSDARWAEARRRAIILGPLADYYLERATSWPEFCDRHAEFVANYNEQEHVRFASAKQRAIAEEAELRRKQPT